MNITKKVPMMSWNDRFALIDAYHPSNTAICTVFNLSPNELKTAQALRNAGTFAPNRQLDTSKFVDLFPDMIDEIVVAVPKQPVYVTQPRVSAKTVHTVTPPETATKKIVVKAPQKRGRKGDKITQALLSVTNEPIIVDSFIRDHGVSLAVLRQSKRFIEHMSSEDVQKIGRIVVKQNKETKVLMIWREDV